MANAKDSKPEEMTIEQMQAEILRVELETKRLLLGKAKKDNAEFIAAEERRHQANKRRMKELAEGRENRYATIKACRHRSGGGPGNILHGGGIGSFSLLTRALMPDGVTILLQCGRCRLLFYTPSEKQRQLWFESYREELAFYKKLLELSIEEGIQHNETRGPTFMFKNEKGVPIIPERV
jgi:hypothetical protein